MTRFEDYYANELRYLADAGRDYARRHPQQAELLDLASVKARDPHVERLFENFAFLSAGVRQKLDDELPELGQALLALLAPHYSRPVPALTTVQLRPDFAQLTGVVPVEAGGEVQSVAIATPDGRKELTCPFTTCYPVSLYPIELIDVRRCGPVGDREGLELCFELRGPARWEQMALDRLRLFLHDDSQRLVYSLHYYLTRQVESIEMTPAAPSMRRPIRIEPVGFARGEEVIPYDVHSFPGYRLLQEYFCFPEKYFYVDIVGLRERLVGLTESQFSVSIWFKGGIPPWWSVSNRNFHQFCTPAINLFDEHAFPIDYNQRTTEYPIYVDKSARDTCRVQCVESVVGRPVGERGAEARSYPAFLDFSGAPADDEGYYCVYQRYDPAGELQCMLSLLQADGVPAVLPEQVLSIDVKAFNGDYPQRLRATDIRYRGPGMDQLVQTVRGLTSPTPVRWAPVGGETMWYLLSHLAANQLSVADADALVGTLRLYDWTNGRANARRIEGLVDAKIREQRATIVRHGIVMQGHDVGLTLDNSCFTDLGDTHLFALVLRHFMALHATVNSFAKLTVEVRNEPSCEGWSWPALNGQQQTV